MSDAATRAILVAGHAVSYAEAYLNGRHDARLLATNADRLLNDLLAIGDANTNAALDSTRVLMIAMMRATRCALANPDDARIERWQHVMAYLVELVRLDCPALRSTLQETRR